ncbi:MAG TPA: multiheme c-type cytochrome [Terriglobales bacterium]|nr:multiheme c-type cytochrome [Terriglobales bacterium]
MFRSGRLWILLVGASVLACPLRGTAQSHGKLSSETQACIACHQQGAVPLVYEQWASSRHAAAGVGCYECHKADKSRPEAFEHNGFTIAVLVGPTQCGACHAREVKEFEASHHAKAGQILGSLDNVLGDVLEGPQADVMGCQKCHGSTVKPLANGKFDPTTWPNEGIGRVNPDGSLGSCSVCHSRHTFSVAIARRPESCGYCHLGPDHPQIEIYNESKHGVTYRAFLDKMNLNSPTWVLGKDYNAAPTCATCHMGATTDLPNTHDVGTRLSWNLRPEVAVRTANWQPKRAEMQQVCSNCHAADWINNFYFQYDAFINMSNDKFFVPAKDVMAKLTAAGKVSKTPFDSQIKWTYFELWHHEGRRARMGASMMGNDYVQWHGMYEVGKIFYGDFLPEADHLMPGVTEPIREAAPNAWLKGLTPETRREMEQYFQKFWTPATAEQAAPTAKTGQAEATPKPKAAHATAAPAK